MRPFVVICVGLVVASAACSRKRTEGASGAATPGCAAVSVSPLRPEQQKGGPGKWSVSLDVQGEVLKTHGPRFEKLGITPNGEAWAGVLEQCLAKLGTPLDADVQLDPEAGSLHAWVGSDASKDRYVSALCRAVEDAKWLDSCLAVIDRSKLDD